MISFVEIYIFPIKYAVELPDPIKNGERIDDTPVHTALREALANCIINADYYGRQGLVIIKKKDVITFSNPGNFRIDIEDAKSGGVSDPRNTTLIKMFNLIDIGERAGSGIPNIYSVWDKQGWEAPIITEDFEPARITMSLSVSTDDTVIVSDDKKVTIKSDDKKATITTNDKKKVTELQKDTIIEYLTDHVNVRSSELAELLGVKTTRVKNLLNSLIADGSLLPRVPTATELIGSKKTVYNKDPEADTTSRLRDFHLNLLYQDPFRTLKKIGVKLVSNHHAMCLKALKIGGVLVYRLHRRE